MKSWCFVASWEWSGWLHTLLLCVPPDAGELSAPEQFEGRDLPAVGGLGQQL